MWCMCLGVYLLRFITLGTKINKKYRNFSVLITEQVLTAQLFLQRCIKYSEIWFIKTTTTTTTTTTTVLRPFVRNLSLIHI